MTAKGEQGSSAEAGGRRPGGAELASAVFGLVSIVAGAAAGLFSDLPPAGQVVGLAAVVLWLVALGALLLWLGGGGDVPAVVRIATLGGFALTAGLLFIALESGPRLNSRTLVLSERGQQIVRELCPDVAPGPEVAADVALSQLESDFVHIELREEGCPNAGRDIRIRSEDLVAVVPES